MHPVASSCFLLFLYFRFSEGLNCPKNSRKIKINFSSTEASGRAKVGQEGHHQAPRRVPGAAQGGRARDPPGCPGWPPEPPFGLYNPSGVETLEQKFFSAETLLFVRRRRFSDRSCRRSCSGTLPERDHPSGRPSIAMDVPRMCRE